MMSWANKGLPDVVVEPDSVKRWRKWCAMPMKRVFQSQREERAPVSVEDVPLYGGILLSTARLNRILEVDTDNLMAIVESGVVLMDFQETVEKMGLFYAPDPGRKVRR